MKEGVTMSDVFIKSFFIDDKKTLKKFIDIYNKNPQKIDKDFKSKFVNKDSDEFKKVISVLNNTI